MSNPCPHRKEELAPNPEVVVQLRVHGLVMTLDAHFEDELDKMVGKLGLSRDKSYLSYRRALLANDGIRVLQILWKESDFIAESELVEASLSKSPRRLTAHSLAVSFSEYPNQVAGMNSRIRTIGLAAYFFGLVERRRISDTTVELRGTIRLHTLMSDIADRYIETLTKFIRGAVRAPASVRSTSKGGTR